MDEEQARKQVAAEIDRLEREARAVIEAYGYKLEYRGGDCFIGNGTKPLEDNYLGAHERASNERSRRLNVARTVAARIPEMREMAKERPTWRLTLFLAAYASVYPDQRAKGLTYKWAQQARAKKPRRRSGSVASYARGAVVSGAKRYAEARKVEPRLTAEGKKTVTQAISRAKRRQ